MDDDLKYKKAIQRLTRTSQTWAKIRKILEADIQANLDLITFLDKIIKEKELRNSAKN
jgi:hypothetical protein